MADVPAVWFPDGYDRIVAGLQRGGASLAACEVAAEWAILERPGTVDPEAVTWKAVSDRAKAAVKVIGAVFDMELAEGVPVAVTRQRMEEVLATWNGTMFTVEALWKRVTADQ